MEVVGATAIEDQLQDNVGISFFNILIYTFFTKLKPNN